MRRTNKIIIVIIPSIICFVFGFLFGSGYIGHTKSSKSYIFRSITIKSRYINNQKTAYH